MSKIVAPDVEMAEEDRLAVLRGLGALDSDSDPYFDRVVRLAAALFGAPRAAVVLVDRDRLWHKACLGIARRDLSLRVKERIQQVGFAALATLMLVVIYNDVISNVLRIKNGG